MIYHCEQCGAALPGGALVCPACGKTFDSPVPADVPTSADPFADLLRGRTADGTPRPVPAPYYASPSSGSKVRWRWAWGFIGIVLVASVALIGWAASALLTHRPGGDATYMQHNLAGNAAVERGDFRTADDEYSQMITMRPRRVDGYLLRAISEDKEHFYSASIRDDTAALALTQEPMSRGDLLYNRGQASAARGDLSSAIDDYTRSYAEYAHVSNSSLMPYVPDREADDDRQRAGAHWERKDYAQAVADSGAAIALGHARPDDYSIRGKAEAALGKNTAAEADFGKALRLDPSYLNAYFGLANMADKKHQYGRAVAAYEQATSAEPENARLWANLGWFQYEAGQTPAAIASDRHALSLDSSLQQAGYNLGLAYASIGRAQDAQTAYAYVLSQSDEANRSAALTDIRTALARQPSSPTLRAALAQVESGAGATRGAPVAARPMPLVTTSPAARRPAAFASELAPEVRLAGYGIQPPSGYTLTQHPTVTLSGQGTDYIWAGPRRADGTTPTLEVEISEDGGKLAAYETSRQVAQQAVDGMSENHTHLTTSPVTECHLAGLSFVRADWSGVGITTGKMYQGDEYWLVSSSHILRLSTHDAAPYSHTTLPMLRASALTFRRT